MRCVALVALLVHCTFALRYIEVGNNRGAPIWIQSQPNDGKPPLRGGQIVKLNPSERTRYDIDDGGWAGRLWAKVGCDDGGNNCRFGQSIPPCPPNGCHPPAETKVEFFFPPMNSPDASFYDISLVDGYSLAAEIIPFRDGNPLQEGSCIRTDCQVNINDCPKGEKSGLGDLTIRAPDAVGCLSPCKKWNYPEPYGYGRDEQEGDGRLLCCPAPVSVEECRGGIVGGTEYVQLVRRVCPTAYSYSYDDLGGLHNCPSVASFVVNFFN